MDLNVDLLDDFIYNPKEKISVDYFRTKYNLDDFLATICYNEFHDLNQNDVIKEEIEKQKELHQFLQNNVLVIN